MSARIFLFFIFLGSILSAIAWLFILLFIDPEKTSVIGFFVFYLSLFLLLFGVFTIISSWLRSKFFRQQIISSRIQTSVRQAIFFAILLVVGAFLQSQNILTWWNILLLIFALTGLEFFFMTRGRSPKRPLVKDEDLIPPSPF